MVEGIRPCFYRRTARGEIRQAGIQRWRDRITDGEVGRNERGWATSPSRCFQREGQRGRSRQLCKASHRRTSLDRSSCEALARIGLGRYAKALRLASSINEASSAEFRRRSREPSCWGAFARRGTAFKASLRQPTFPTGRMHRIYSRDVYRPHQHTWAPRLSTWCFACV